MAHTVEAIFKATGAEKFASSFRKAQESTKKFKSAGDKLKSVGSTLTKTVTAPLVGLGTAAMVTGAKFSDQMSTVKAITGATGDEMDKMRELAKEMGRTTRFSASRSEEHTSELQSRFDI